MKITLDLSELESTILVNCLVNESKNVRRWKRPEQVKEARRKTLSNLANKIVSAEMTAKMGGNDG